MCGRFTLRTPLHVLMKHFALESNLQLAVRYNIAPTQDVLTVRQVEQCRQPAIVRWGLIPFWANDPKIGNSLINARSEEAAKKPSFRAAMKTRRCLIPADGFFEWKKVGKAKQPYYFTVADDRPFAFAGLWERWHKGEGKPIESCTILTTSANELVKPFHERMPVILSAADYDAWLDPAPTDGTQLSYLFEPYPPGQMAARPVNPVVNNARQNVPECIEPVNVE